MKHAREPEIAVRSSLTDADPSQHVRVQNCAWAFADSRVRKMRGLGIKTMAHVEKELPKFSCLRDEGSGAN